MLVAFAIALAHSAIPHGHPAPKQQTVKVEEGHTKHHHTHQHNSGRHDHQNHTTDHNHHNQDESLPVFVHFSNADYVGGSSYNLSANGKFLVECICFPELNVETPESAIRRVNIPRARDLPSDELQSSGSLRAPPFFS